MSSQITASYTLNLKYKANIIVISLFHNVLIYYCLAIQCLISINDVNDNLDSIIYQVQIHINYQEIRRTKFIFGFHLLFIILSSH